MITAAWFIGFLEGEGCFLVSLFNYKGKPKLQPEFAIDLVIQDGLTLKKIKDYLKMGTVIKNKRKRRKNTNDLCRFRIKGMKNILKFITFLDKNSKYFNSKKIIPYLRWKKVVFMIRDKKHKTQEGFSDICKLRKKINKNSRGDL